MSSGAFVYLFFSGALSISSGAFGDDTVSTVVQSVNCYGNETEMLNCSFSTSDVEMCLEHSAAVICQGQKGWCACTSMTTSMCVQLCAYICMNEWMD